MSVLPGIGGSLFPGRYLSDRVLADAETCRNREFGRTIVPVERRRQQFVRWWRGVTETCGPASGLRTLFDVVAMPLFGMLGYRARDATFEHGQARARLVTRGGENVGLVLAPWASRPPGIWRDLFDVSRDADAVWCHVLAPPFLSLVNVRGQATRRSLDFVFPAAFEAGSFSHFWTLARADSFVAPAPIDELLQRADHYQDRVRNDLQRGVVDALDALSRAKTTGRDESLVIVYRILFLLFAEARDLVPRGHPTYGRSYSVSRLVADALVDREARGSWEALAAITRLSRLGCRTDDLIVRPFNGRLFARQAAPSLETRPSGPRRRPRSTADDEAMRHTLVALGSREEATGRQTISYADLGVEQLGTVYERVLDLDPTTSTHKHSALRKQTGTFYTPQPLAEFVVRRTLAPLVAHVPADRILSLRIVDPAMGSGAFLVAACRYLAAAYERALIAEGRLAPADIDADARAVLRRLIAERCLAGVDSNPVAVQLARLSLWLATLAQGRPLTFLDHRLRAGNSLVGATPDDLARVVSRRSPTREPLPLFVADALEHAMREIVRPLIELGTGPADTVADVRAKEARWERLAGRSSPLACWRLAADAWCARWFPAGGTSPVSPAELRALIDALVRSDTTLPASHLSRRVVETQEASRRHGFFHWPLEFGDVFYDETGRPTATPGFDAVLGNPPWEVLRRDQGQLAQFVRQSGIYAACARGHLNLYQPFLERALSICRRGGRVGLIVPWGVAVDDGAASLRHALVHDGGLETFVGLDNSQGLFPIHRGVRFAVVVAQPGRPAGEIRARFGVRTHAEIDALPGRDDPRDSQYSVRFTARSLRQIGGPTLRVPDVRCTNDLALLERLIGTFPSLGNSLGWGARFGRELNASDDRESFGTTGLPVVEGKHLEPFRTNVRNATFCIDPDTAARLLPDVRYTRPRLGYRDVSAVGNTRSLIAAVLPADVVTTHTVFCLRTDISLEASHFLCGVLNSFVVNFIVRMLMGGHVTTTLAEQLPVPVWRADTRQRRIARLARRLASARGSDRLAARLDAEVAALFGVDLREYRRVVEGFRLVPKAFREMAIEERTKITS
jgi:hypothetical protein